ncbi:hypothetical protein [Virgibacillus ihumii]|uniref:TlpA family protein disulfide reductase n=1 Tax=Virgibacillus ihumii TaxID=2686091 RepID=UPI0031B574A6
MYQIRPIPTTYMIDAEGVIRFRAFGAMNYDFMVQELEKNEIIQPYSTKWTRGGHCETNPFSG